MFWALLLGSLHLVPQSKADYQDCPPHPPPSASASGVRGLMQRAHKAIHTAKQPPRSIVYPRDNIDKGHSLVGCLHQSVAMETPRETIPKPSLSTPPHIHTPCSCVPAPSGRETVGNCRLPNHCHLQMGHSWITLKPPPAAELILLKGP